MAKKKPAPTPPIVPEPSPVSTKAAVPPAPVEHDFHKSVKRIVSKSNKPLTFKQIHALHETHVTATGSVEDSILSLVKNNKLKLTAGTEKTVTLSRESLARLVESQPNDATMTMNVNSVSPMIDDNPVRAVQQVLCVLGYKDVTSRQIYTVLQQLGKNGITLGMVENALYELVNGTNGVFIKSYGDPADLQYSC